MEFTLYMRCENNKGKHERFWKLTFGHMSDWQFLYSRCLVEPRFILFLKQFRSRSASFWWSKLIRIYTVFLSAWKYKLKTEILQVTNVSGYNMEMSVVQINNQPRKVYNYLDRVHIKRKLMNTNNSLKQQHYISKLFFNQINLLHAWYFSCSFLTYCCLFHKILTETSEEC